MQIGRPLPAAIAISPPPGGRALDGLARRAFEADRGEVLIAAGAPLVAAYLVTDGLVAMLARTPAGAAAEAGLVGSGGLVGHAAALGASVATADAVALTGVKGFELDAAALRTERPELRRDLMDYALARVAEIERLCVCVATHSIEKRLARWLLSAARLVGDSPIEITHQQFATLFGVRRASVTTSLHLLEGERAVRCRRGRVEIRDLRRLEAASCGCHDAFAPRLG